MLNFIGIMYLAFLVPALVFYRKPPGKITRFYGYRTNRARKNLANWTYANRVAGKLLLLVTHLATILSLLSVWYLQSRISPNGLFFIIIFWFGIFPIIIVPVVEYKLGRFEAKQKTGSAG